MNDTKKNPSAQEIILKTKRPFNFYLTIVVITGFLVLFTTIVLTGRLDIWGASFCFIFFSIILYVHTGRYLAEITLYKNRIDVCYCFPWNNSKTFEFDSIIELDTKEMPILGSYNRWYSSFQWLYLKNDKKQTCQIRYNINASDQEKLLYAIKVL